MNVHEKEQKPCPICGTLMHPCDYSPIYGRSWYHPASTSTAICKYSDSLVFGGKVASNNENEKEKDNGKQET